MMCGRRRLSKLAAGAVVSAVLWPVTLPATEAASDPSALYERYDQLVMQSRSLGPDRSAAPRPGEVPVYVLPVAPVDGRRLHVLLRNEQGDVVARLDVPAGQADGAPIPAGRLDAALLADAPALEWFVEGAAATEGRVFELGDDVRMLQLRLVGDADGPRKLEIDAWAEAREGSVLLGLRRLFSFGGDGVTRYRPLDIGKRPDVVHAAARCRAAPGWDGLDALRLLEPESGMSELPAYWEARMRCALELGARELALQYLERWHESGGSDLAIQRAAVSFARLDLDREAHERARRSLGSIVVLEALGTRHEAAARDIQARILIDEGNYVGAAEMLGQGPHLRLVELWEGDSRILRSLDFLRINQAVALMGTGRVDEGRALLDMVGSRYASDTLAIRLRDRANVMLGWNLLRAGHGPEAAAVFDRVALDGPFAAPALLGRGWASIIGDEGRVARAEIPGLSREGLAVQPLLALQQSGAMSCFEARQVLDQPVSGCPGSRRFARAELQDESEEALRSALRYWSRLLSADLRSVEAAEGVVAAADAYDVLGDPERAAQLLAGAMERLENAQSRLAGARAHLEGASAVRTYAEMLNGGSAEGAAGDFAYFLRDWASRNESTTMLRTRERALALAESLRRKAPGSARAEALGEELHLLAADLERRMQQQMRAALTEADRDLDRYREATLLKLARVQERRLLARP